MELEGIFIPLGFFLMVFGIVCSYLYFRHKTRHDVQLTMRAMIESGQPLSAELLEQMTTAIQPQRDDLRRGVILMALGIAILALALIVGEREALGVAAFPISVALAYLGLWWVNGRNAD